MEECLPRLHVSDPYGKMFTVHVSYYYGTVFAVHLCK